MSILTESGKESGDDRVMTLLGILDEGQDE